MSKKVSKTKSKRQINSPFLKHIKIRRHKIVRYKSNYGANIVDKTKYFKNITFEKLLLHDNRKSQEILEGATQNVEKRKKKKNLSFIYYILNIAVIAIVLTVQLSQESNPKESISSILNINWWFILAAFGTFVIGMMLEQIRYAFLIHKATGVYRFSLAYKVGALGRYYDTITPLGTGGQPFQVLYTNKYGIKAGEGISIAMGKYIFYQIVYFILVTYFVFKAVFTNPIMVTVSENVSQGLVSTFMWVGYAILAVVIITILLISLNRRFGAGLIAGILKLLSKIRFGKFKLIKDYRKTFLKVMKTVNVWQSTTKKYSKSFWVVFVNIMASIVFFFVNYSMPFFIYCAFEGWHPEVWSTIITFAVMVDLTSAFNPIPMGTGTADLSFTVLYGSLFSVSGASIWALIIWRVLCNYIYIIQGLVIVNYDYFIGNKRLEKYKEVWMLPLRERIKLSSKRFKNKNKQETD